MNLSAAVLVIFAGLIIGVVVGGIGMGLWLWVDALRTYRQMQQCIGLRDRADE